MKIKNNKIIIFIAISNILIISQAIFTKLLDTFKQSSWIALLVYIVFISIIGFLFKGFSTNTNIITDINKHKIIKYLLGIYLIYVISSSIFLASIIIKDYFYNKASLIIVFSIITTICFILSKLQFSKIINVSMIFFFFFLFLYFTPFFHLKERNFLLLLPFELDIKDLIKVYIILVFPLENILFSLYSNQIDKGFRRKDFILGNLFAYSYLLLIIIDSLSLLGANFFENTRFGEFIRWEVYQGNKFIEAFDIFFLIIMTASIIFRGIIYFNMFRKTFSIKRATYKQYYLLFTVLLVQFTLYVYINYFQDYVEYSLPISLIMISIIFTYLIYLSYKTKKKGIIINE